MNRTSPSKLEDHLGYWLRSLSNLVSHTFAARLEKMGLTVAQWVVLRALYDAESLTLNEAAKLVGVDKSTLSRMIERLVSKEWVNRTEGKDRRSLELKLTASGRKMVTQAARLADENDAVFFQTLSSRQREEFLATIQTLLKANGWPKEGQSVHPLE